MSRKMKKRVLLTTVNRPFADKEEGKSVGSELFHMQLTRSQGIFSVRQMLRGWGLDYIAANLNTPTTVLHYPTLKDLKNEINRNQYTHIGIHFVVSTFQRMQKIVALIRQFSPESEIILGGYGTVLPDDIIKPFGDHICRGEGIAFMKQLMGEDNSQPIKHPYAPVKLGKILSISDPEVVGHVTSGLGCSNGCDFCCTSHFFSRKFHPFITEGKEIYDVFKNQYLEAEARGQKMGHIGLIDEDFFFNEKRTRQYLEEIRKKPFSFSIMGFGSIRSLSQYSAREIAAMGFDIIWIGLEGKDATFGKLKGTSPLQLVRELREYGVSVLGSSIIGLPYQNRDIIGEEFDRIMEIEPAFCQFLIYFAIPGTPLFNQMVKDDRFRDQYKDYKGLKKCDGFAQHLKYEEYEDGELEEIQEWMYTEEYKRLGPSIFRVCEIWLKAIPKLEGSGDKVLELRAQRLRETVKKIRPIIPLGKWLAKSPQVKDRLNALNITFTEVMGKWTLIERISVCATPLLGIWTYIKNLLYPDNMTRFIRVENHELLHNDASGGSLFVKSSAKTFE
jgi:radical SAM superfamily enzyme YgiQ (UPF0313 family)